MYIKSIIYNLNILLLLVTLACSSSFKQGEALYLEGNYSDAVRSLEKYVESNPNDSVAHYTLADALYFKYSDEYNKNSAVTNDLNLSLMHFSKSIELNPQYAEAYCQRGVIYLVLGDMEKSKKDYETAMSLKPNFDRTYYNRGYWHEKQRQFEKAIADYKKYISLSNNNKWRDDAARRIESMEMKIKLKTGS